MRSLAHIAQPLSAYTILLLRRCLRIDIHTLSRGPVLAVSRQATYTSSTVLLCGEVVISGTHNPERALMTDGSARNISRRQPG
jgi:hypothetical protein